MKKNSGNSQSVIFKRVENEHFGKYKDIFGKHRSETIFNYAFDNQIGKLEVDNLEKPEYARFLFGSIMFFTGKVVENKATEILTTFPPRVAIAVEDKGWYELIEEYFSAKEGIKFGKQDRTKFSTDSLSLEHLQSLKKPLPEGVSQKKIDE